MKKYILPFALLLLLGTQTKAQQLDTITATYTDTIYSSYTTSFCTGGGCLYSLPVVLPPGFTVTEIIDSFAFETLGTCDLNEGGYIISLGSCKTNCIHCEIALPGVCNGNGFNFYDSLKECLPAPNCMSDTINFVLDFFRTIEPGNGCGRSCVVADGPWTMTVIGRIDSVLIQPSVQQHGDTVCQGDSVLLTTKSCFGISTYTTTWYPGGVVGDSIFVTPDSNTDYIAKFTGVAGDIATDTISLIVVNCNVGIESYTSGAFSVSPNPATNQLTIHTSSFHNEAAIVSIMNVLGQEASPPSPLGKGEDAVLDISKLPSGMYFLQLKSESGSAVKKFVKE